MNQAATFQLEMTRFIRAPREKVFDAFTHEDALAAWHCPRGMQVAQVQADARVGGRYRIAMTARSGASFAVRGEYQALDRADFLAYTWAWENGSLPPDRITLIEVTLTSRDGGTSLHMRHTGFPDAMSADGHMAGWQSVFNRLSDYLDPAGTAGTLAVIGDPRSSYCRTVRMALAEKGVAYALEPAAPHTPEIEAHHPFGRIPVLRDGETEFYETRAILGYIEDAFDGPSLLPTGPAAVRARGEQWISVINCYTYDAMVRRYVFPNLFAKGGQPDRAAIDAALPELDRQLALFDQAYGASDYLAGSTPSMADYLLAPILVYVEKYPEGAALFAKYANLRRAQAVIRARPSFAATAPPSAG
ncbi:SRPBCC domain-containing protein [Dyella soli]|uniref:glutathione transferase n=1 Tax=Dyella soli TaxID=522319 RepID=A0A4R0YNL3_9GAMM|nr:SRPBCC domain-containing protein [Dyella soli]TCI10517.1 glutathione S-transferase [Dyella soli]